MQEVFHIVHSPSLGDTLAATPTTRKISLSYNRKINVVTKLPEIYKNNPYVEKLYTFEEYEKLNTENAEKLNSFVGIGYINRTGIQKKHNVIDIRKYHSFDVGFDLLPEEMHYDFIPDNDIYENIKQKYVVLHPSQTWPSRTYSKENWQKIINELEELGYFIVLIGKDDKEFGFFNIDKSAHSLELKNGIDLINKINLSQAWHLLNGAEYVITMDSGILHLAGTTNTFIIQLGSSIDNRLRAPYRNASQDFKYKYISGDCGLFCASQMKYGIKEWGTINGVAPLIGCLENKPSFECHPNPNSVIDFIKNNKQRKKYIFIAGHLSTGGGPKYLEWLIDKTIKEGNDVKVIEWNLYAIDYTVQRNTIIKLVGQNNFYSVGYFAESDEEFYPKIENVKNIISEYEPDYIHLNDPSENFAIKGFNQDFTNYLFDKNRKYKIFECFHDTYFDMSKKVNIPDEFWFCSDFYVNKCDHIDIPKKIVEMTLPKKNRPNRNETLKSLGLDPNYFHVLQVGLFHQNKNQKYTYEVAKKFLGKQVQFHFIGNLCYFNECGIEEQENCKIWGERSDVDTFMSCMDLFIMPSHRELNPISIKEAVSWNMTCYISELDTYKHIYEKEPLVTFLKGNNIIDYISNQLKTKVEKNNIIVTFCPLPKVEILGTHVCDYEINFIDSVTNINYFNSKIKNNMWCSSLVERYVNWTVEIKNLTLGITHVHNFNPNKKKIKIINESGSLGDCIAWLPAVDDFQKKHNCVVHYYANKKDLFDKQYPNIVFKNYDERENDENYYACYYIGIFPNKGINSYTKDYRVLNLQEVAYHILGLDFVEKRTKLNKPHHTKYIKRSKKYVCIATQSTAQCKYWNNKDGWTKTVSYLQSLGYDVVCVDKHRYYGIENWMNGAPETINEFAGECPFPEVIDIIDNCDFFIGLSSGLSWLAWALNKEIIMISSFTAFDYEFTTKYRLFNKNKCNSCFNDPKYKFEPSDWLWCPAHKNTDRMFECHGSITFEMMKDKIDELIKDNNN